jgi:hypothetical protein
MQNEKSIVERLCQTIYLAADTVALQKLSRLDGQNLTPPVVPARWAGRV